MACLQRICRLNIRNYFQTAKSLYSTNISNNVTNNVPMIFSATSVKNPWIWQKQSQIEIPFTKISQIIELPRSVFWIPPKNDPEISSKFEISDPLSETNIEKHAVKLIVIRRHKMRKHKLKKLRKKMKFEWAKRRQRREMRKEKLFQGELLAQIKDAEKFSAEEFVAEKIKKATEVPIPRFWKGRRLPEFIIREKLGLQSK